MGHTTAVFVGLEVEGSLDGKSSLQERILLSYNPYSTQSKTPDWIRKQSLYDAPLLLCSTLQCRPVLCVLDLGPKQSLLYS